MTKPLWAPWRLEYIQQADEATACVFCAEAAGELTPDESLLLRRDELASRHPQQVPYSSGHTLVAPVRHVGAFTALTDAEAAAIHRPRSRW